MNKSKAVKTAIAFKRGQWYSKAILWAVEQGITNGNGKGGFSPTVPCSRSQIVTFLYRYMEG